MTTGSAVTLPSQSQSDTSGSDGSVFMSTLDHGNGSGSGNEDSVETSFVSYEEENSD